MLSLSSWIVLSMLSVVPPLGTGLLRWRHLGEAQRILTGWLLFEGVFELLSLGWSHLWGNNLPLLHLFIAAETLAFAWVLSRLISRILPQGWWTLIPLAMAALILVNALLWQPLTAYPSLPRSAEGIVLSTLALLVFLDLYRQPEALPLEKEFRFWLGIGLLLYFAGNVLVWAFGQQIAAQRPGVFLDIWTLHAMFNILFHLLLTIGLLCKERKATL